MVDVDYDISIAYRPANVPAEVLHPVTSDYFQSIQLTEAEGDKQDSVQLELLGMPPVPGMEHSRRIAEPNDILADSRIVVDNFAPAGQTQDYGRYIITTSGSTQDNLDSILSITGTRIIANTDMVKFLKDTAPFQVIYGARFLAGLINPDTLTYQFDDACGKLPYSYRVDGVGGTNLVRSMSRFIDYKIHAFSNFADMETFLNACGVGVRRGRLTQEIYRASGLEQYDMAKGITHNRTTNARTRFGEGVSVLYPLYDGLVATGAERATARNVILESPLKRKRPKQGISPTSPPNFYARYEKFNPATQDSTGEEAEALIIDGETTLVIDGAIQFAQPLSETSTYVFAQRIYGSRQEAELFERVARFETRLNAEALEFKIQGNPTIQPNELLRLISPEPGQPANATSRPNRTIYIRVRRAIHGYDGDQGFTTTIHGFEVHDGS